MYFLNYVEKFKKDENTWNIVKLCQKTKIGNQALITVPLAKKKTQPKNKKRITFCQEPSGALGIGICAEGGPSAKRCTLPTAPASCRLSHPILQGKPNASHMCARIKLHTHDRQNESNTIAVIKRSRV
jgi:hypothetical protein